VTDLSIDNQAWPLVHNEVYLAQIILVVESSSTHPLATALVRSSKTIQTRNQGEGEAIITVLTSEEIAGMGMQAKIRFSYAHMEPIDMDVLIGNERLMGLHNCVTLSVEQENELNLWKSQAKSVVLAAMRRTESNDPYRGIARYGIADAIRPESKSVLDRLRQQGFQIHLLSGDNSVTANAIAAQLKIGKANVKAEVLPEQKGYHIQQLQQQTVRKTRIPWLPAWCSPRYDTRAIVMFVGGETWISCLDILQSFNPSRLYRWAK